MAEPHRIEVLTLTATPIGADKAVITCVAQSGNVTALILTRSELSRFHKKLDDLLKSERGA